MAQDSAEKKILWVEDDSFLINIIAQKLEEQHWKVLYALDGNKALDIAEKEHPELIVLDILLPGMDGLKVLGQLKADEKTKDIPVIMFSNLSDKAKIEESMKLGAERFFVKASVDWEILIKEIVKITSK